MKPGLHWRRHGPGDHLAIAADLTLEEDGALLRLLDLYWARGDLPRTEAECARLIRAPNCVEMIGALLSRFFVKRRGKWVCPDLDAQRAYALELSRKRSIAGRSGRAKQIDEIARKIAGQLPSNSDEIGGQTRNEKTRQYTVGLEEAFQRGKVPEVRKAFTDARGEGDG